jgi:hypothetical protein
MTVLKPGISGVSRFPASVDPRFPQGRPRNMRGMGPVRCRPIMYERVSSSSSQHHLRDSEGHHPRNAYQYYPSRLWPNSENSGCSQCRSAGQDHGLSAAGAAGGSPIERFNVSLHVSSESNHIHFLSNRFSRACGISGKSMYKIWRLLPRKLWRILLRIELLELYN